MKEIPFTQGKVAIVDDIDFEFLNQWNWCSAHGYAIRNSKQSDFDCHIVLERKQIRMHHIVLERKLNIKIHSTTEVDHKNQNPCDNRRSNLRLTPSRSMSVANTKSRGGSSKFKGVSFRKDTSRWAAYITVNYHRHCLGCFGDEIEAARAYNKAAIKYFGEFAHLNNV